MTVGMVSVKAECANAECPNKPGEGEFCLVKIGSGNIVGGHRGMTFLMCMPCTRALQEVIK